MLRNGRTALLLLVCALLACKGGQGDGPPFLHLRMVLPENFPTQLIASADIVLSPAPGQPGPSFVEGVAFYNVGGIDVSIRTQDEDGDGRRELAIYFAENPFRGTSADLYLYPRNVFQSDGGGPPVTPPMLLHARVFSFENQLLATGDATKDGNGDPIQFAASDRSVDVLISCVAGAACDNRPSPVPSGTGIVRVTVSRARDCPTSLYAGDLYVSLVPGINGGVSSQGLSAVQPGVDFASEGATVTLDLPPAPPGPYFLFAVEDVGGGFAQSGYVAGPGDLLSPLRSVDVIAGRMIEASLTLDEVNEVGRCVGGPPQAPPSPVVLGTVPLSPASSNRPTVVGTASAGTRVRIYADPSCGSEPLGDGLADSSGSFRIPVSVADNTTTTFFATAENDALYRSPCSQSFVSFVEDSVPPTAPTALTTSPASPSSDPNPLIQGKAEAGATVRLYANPSCTGPAVAAATADTLGAFRIPAGVSENATTVFSATATDAAGNSSGCSTPVTYTNDRRAPAPPGDLGTSPASPANANSLFVTGTAEPGSTVAIYTDVACAGTPLASGIADPTGAFRISVSVADNTTTTFYAAATDAAGNESVCSAAGITYVEDSAAPSIAQAVVVDGLLSDVAYQQSTSVMQASWSLFSDPSGLTYEYNLSTSPACMGDVVATTDVGNATAKVTTGLTLADGAIYYNCVRAVDRAGNRSAFVASNGVRVDATAPSPPAMGLYSIDPGNRQVALSWPAWSDAVSGVASYDVAMCFPAPCTPATLVATEVTATSATIAGLSSCTSYSFAVRARDNAGNVAALGPTFSGGPSLPAPTGLTVVAGAGAAEVSFAAVPNASDYEVCYRASAAACAGAFSVSTGGRTLTRLTGLPVNTAFFAVRALDGACRGNPSADFAVTPVLAQSGYRKDGVAMLDRLGSSVIAAGDANRDHRTDILAIAPADADAGTPGKVYLYSGSDGTLLQQRIGTPSSPIASADAVGDVDGDGRSDFVVGMPDAGVGGLVTVYSGGGAVIRTIVGASGAKLGSTVFGIGDVDGDYHSDFGALNGAGAAFVYSGATGAPLSWTLGAAMPCGDVNGDGHVDYMQGIRGAKGSTPSIGIFSGSDAAQIDSIPYDFAAPAGDVDGDGRADIIVGLPDAAPNGLVAAGSVLVLSGKDLSQTLFQIDGTAAGDRLGAFIGTAGDVDGDGRDDVLVGAPGASPNGLTGAGSLFVYSGAGGALLYRLDGTAAGEGFGSSAAAGDLDGDGRIDFVVGAPHASPGGLTEAGSLRAFTTSRELGISPGESSTPSVLQGLTGGDAPVAIAGSSTQFTPSGGTPPYAWRVVTDNSGGAAITATGLYTAGPTNGVVDTIRVTDALGRSRDTRIAVIDHTLRFSWSCYGNMNAGTGTALASLADLNGDGKDELVVSRPRQPTVLFGWKVGVLSLSSGCPFPLLYWDVPSTADNFGAALATGDVNGDGRPDIVVGAPGTPDGGMVYVYSGTDGGLLYQKAGAPGQALGSALAVGDLDADGRSEFIAGAPQASVVVDGGVALRAGSVFIYSGSTGNLQQPAKNGGAGDELGTAVAVAGNQLLIGAPGNGAGRVFVYSASGAFVRQVTGVASGDRFGSALTAVGDLDGDGTVDFLVGAPYASPGGLSQAGRAAVYSGMTGQSLGEWSGPAAGDRLGFSVSSADLNGDGKPDLLVGAPSCGAACPASVTGNAGSVYAYSGSNFQLLYQRHGALPGDFFGYAVSGAGEQNGDGRADFAVGAPGAPVLGTSGQGNYYVFVSDSLRPWLSRPTSLVATAVSGTDIALAWTDNSGTGFQIEYRTPTAPWTPYASVGPNVTLKAIGGLTPNTSYLFRVKAFDASTDSLWSPEVSATTRP
jgi:hypothetical protein